MWKPDAPSSNSPPSKLESSPDLIELFLPGTNSAIDFSKAELAPQQAESILTCTLSDMIYGSCDHWHLNHLQSEVLHGDKNNLIRWLACMRRDRECLESTVQWLPTCVVCNFFMCNTHCSINDFLRVWFRHGNFRLGWKSPSSSAVPLNPRVRGEPSNANAARKSITICCSVSRCRISIIYWPKVP